LIVILTSSQAKKYDSSACRIEGIINKTTKAIKIFFILSPPTALLLSRRPKQQCQFC